jgi:hypothetical protein
LLAHFLGEVSNDLFGSLENLATSGTGLHNEHSVDEVGNSLQLEGDVSVSVETENFGILIERQR